MASEKLDVTTTTESYSKEAGSDGIDTELQARDFGLTPADAARRGILEVRLLNCDGNKGDRVDRGLTELPAEVHQPVVDRLLQHRPALLVGNYSHHVPIRVAQWRTFGLGLRVHFCWLRRYRGGLYDGRNGLHVCSVRPCLHVTNVPVGIRWLARSIAGR